ncbi:MAG: prepilin-type N-terminal cleavage/methylation domain-containing protein [Clostridiales Family XIII bacterium]|nr:prepilin-type N-terminal cleavage/methylation domain-containing protein [Clostridiales Family XIII bacterium]
MRAGFTLVEVIVVIVIIAILAAIGVPALTGYIDKAQDRKYIAEARNRMTALRVVLDEAYADGEFKSTVAAETYFLEGDPASQYVNALTKIFRVTNFTAAVLDDTDLSNSNRFLYYRRAAALMAEDYPSDNLAPSSSFDWYWAAHIIGPRNASTTLNNADGFVYMLFPEGLSNGKPVVWVTYKLSHLAPTADTFSALDVAERKASYDPNAGYEVYHCIY